MAKKEVRDPSSHRTPSQVRKMIRGYDAEPENVKKRTLRNQARAKFKEAGLVQKGDGKDIDHIKPMRSGGSNTPGNLRVMSRSVNRGWNKKK